MKRKLAEIIDVIFGFRKFLLMLAVLVLGIVFRVKSLISGSEMVDLLKSTTVAFMAANGIEHFTTMVKDYVASKDTSAAPIAKASGDAEDEVEPLNG